MSTIELDSALRYIVIPVIWGFIRNCVQELVQLQFKGIHRAFGNVPDLLWESIEKLHSVHRE